MKLKIYGTAKDNASGGSFDIRTLFLEVVPEGFSDEFTLEAVRRLEIALEIRIPALNGIWVRGKTKIK